MSLIRRYLLIPILIFSAVTAVVAPTSIAEARSATWTQNNSGLAFAKSNLTATSTRVPTVIQKSSARLPISAIREMNYSPSANPWDKMWLNYSHAQVASDFAQIAALGANTVRIAVSAWAIGYPKVSAQGAAKFKDIVATAAANGLYVQLTLFDWWGSWTDFTGSVTWLHSLLDPYVDDSRIVLIELKNEIAMENPAAVTWASRVLPVLAGMSPAIPRTISMDGHQDLQEFNALIAATGTSLSVIDIHLYGAEYVLLGKIRDAQSVANGRPIFVGEVGRSTFGTATDCNRLAQLSFYQRIFFDLAQAGISAVAPWTLNDFQAEGLPPQYVGTAQADFGLRTTAGDWKPSKTAVVSYFQGVDAAARVAQFAAANYSQLAFDQSFECDFATASDNSGKDAWAVYNSSLVAAGGAVAQADAPDGAMVGYLRGATGDKNDSASLMHVFSVWSARPMTVSAKVNSAQGTGTTMICVSFFNNGKYMQTVNSPVAVNGRAGWQQLAVTFTPPAGATTFQVHLKSIQNPGTIYWDYVSIANAAPTPTTPATESTPVGGIAIAS